MTIYRPQLLNVNNLKQIPIKVTHPYHMIPNFENILKQGEELAGLGDKIGTEGVLGRKDSFSDAMLRSLDQVSAYQQFASDLNQQAIIDPDSVDVHDITIAQAQASLSLNITRNILNRLVQSWRDIINTR